VQTLLSVQPAHERDVICKRFGFDGVPATLDKTAIELGVAPNVSGRSNSTRLAASEPPSERPA
jgi:hypothetical protein